ncbi:helix-turn-helix transcriptional regulator [Amnibacterium sp.]|uniref:helix-turn-helix transcriptional regulator n=1 Tax=Amnibacterium sp. TaxID=1872496 RepID=UPI002632BBD2|nr:helix-turn-helix transcriptional regulator [Amnibacterium sp.]MCU1473819.1 transcriptional regulator, LuxR family [Amnibacterium sp.]
MLRSLYRLIPFDAAWIARTDRSGYVSLASMGLDTRVVHFLSGPKMAHDIEATGTDRSRPPLSPSDLPYPAEELATWAECLLPADIHEALAVALFEPGGRHVGFLALLSGERRPPKPSSRRRLAEVAGLLAQGIDPMRSLADVSRLVSGAFAGVLLFEDGSIESLPGMPGDDLLAVHSGLLTTVGARVITGETHLSFLWPRDATASHEYVRVSYLTGIGSAFPDLLGIVLLSSVETVHRLTARELEVLGMIVDGFSNHEIARRLVVTTRTVAAHVEHILAKLSSPTRTYAAVRAEREGIYVPVAGGARAG